jgi:hypothetical protein
MTLINKELISHPMNWILLFLMSILIMFVGQMILRYLGIGHPMNNATASS